MRILIETACAASIDALVIWPLSNPKGPSHLLLSNPFRGIDFMIPLRLSVIDRANLTDTLQRRRRFVSTAQTWSVDRRHLEADTH